MADEDSSDILLRIEDLLESFFDRAEQQKAAVVAADTEATGGQKPLTLTLTTGQIWRQPFRYLRIARVPNSTTATIQMLSIAGTPFGQAFTIRAGLTFRRPSPLTAFGGFIVSGNPSSAVAYAGDDEIGESTPAAIVDATGAFMYGVFSDTSLTTESGLRVSSAKIQGKRQDGNAEGATMAKGTGTHYILNHGRFTYEVDNTTTVLGANAGFNASVITTGANTRYVGMAYADQAGTVRQEASATSAGTLRIIHSQTIAANDIQAFGASANQNNRANEGLVFAGYDNRMSYLNGATLQGAFNFFSDQFSV